MNEKEIKNLINETMLEMDKKTGLNGSIIPITFTSSLKTKGTFNAKIIYQTINNRKVIKEFIPTHFSFSEYLFDGRYDLDIIKEVIKHEYIHYYCSVKYPKKIIHHGYEFKSACRKYGVDESTTFNHEVSEEFKESNLNKKLVYILTCTNCHSEIIRQKKSKAVTNCENYRCGSCGGTLTCSQDYRFLV